MGTRKASVVDIDNMLKAMLTLSRATERVLESKSVSINTGARLGGTKLQLLRLLNNQGDQKPSQMARFLGVTKPAVSQIIASMHQSKLVTRKTASSDRREICIRLTKRGKSAYQSVIRAQRQLVRTALRQSTNGEAKDWIATMHDISSAFAKADTTFKDYCLQCGAHIDGTCVLEGGDAQCYFLKPDKNNPRTQ